jgi:hypothetical protein
LFLLTSATTLVLCAILWGRFSSYLRRGTVIRTLNQPSDLLSSSSSSTAAKQIKWLRVVLFGDSLIQEAVAVGDGGHWGAMLASRLQENGTSCCCEVIARGFRGYTSRMLDAALPHFFESFGSPIVAVVILAGTNDALTNQKRRVPVGEYKRNLVEMMSFLMVNIYCISSDHSLYTNHGIGLG